VLEEVVTGDGTNTIYSDSYKEHYHSINEGAYTESLKKHIYPAVRNIEKSACEEIVILDICFGLGYNALTAIKMLRSFGLKKLKIISPEINRRLVESLSEFAYPAELGTLKHIVDFIAKNGFYEDEFVRIDVIFDNARSVVKNILPKSVDIVFQDAFGPKNNPELWTVEYFSDIEKILKPSGIITTYSKANGVRLAMREVGLLLYEHDDKAIRSGTIGLKYESELFKKIDANINTLNAKAFRDKDL